MISQTPERKPLDSYWNDKKDLGQNSEQWDSTNGKSATRKVTVIMSFLEDENLEEFVRDRVAAG